MAYISAAYSRNWSYQKGGTDFQAKVGAMLTNGADLQAQVQQETFNRQSHAADRRSAQPQRPKGSGNVNDNPYKLSAAAQIWNGPHPGFAWVDAQGHPLAVGPPLHASMSGKSTECGSSGSAAGGGLTAGSSSSTTNHHSTQNSTNRGPSYAGMTASQRSMTLWERISPGMLPDTTKTPPATTAEAYVYEPALLEPLDFTHHLKKSV